MNPSSENFTMRLVRSLANSRFLMISAFLHILLVLLFGGTVLFNKYIEPPDFDAGGGDFLTNSDVAAPPQEQTQPMPTPSMAVVTPTITAPTATMSAIVSMSQTASTFAVPVAPTVAPAISNTLAEKVAAATVTAKSGAMGSLPGTMAGRGSARRGTTMAQNGGKMTSEQAVLNALRWLQKVQNKDGTWGSKFRGGMTGLASLCYLGHGETPTTSREFGIVIDNAIKALVAEGTKSQGRLCYSSFNNIPAAYQHAIAAYALGEAYTMTKDESIAPVLKQAVDYILKGQRKDGGWAYNYDLSGDPDEHGSIKSDTSVSGWQIQALKAFHLTGIPNDAVNPVMDNAIKNLERVYDPKNGSFGYRKAGDYHANLTGVGVLCKLFWQGKPDKMVRDALKNIGSKDVKYGNQDANLYAWYYDTQACFQAQGGAWEKWNRSFQDEIVGHQSPEGSWPPTGAAAVHEGNKVVDREVGGMNNADMDSQIYRTALCTLMLEVYYRYLPTGKDGSAGPSTPSNL